MSKKSKKDKKKNRNKMSSAPLRLPIQRKAASNWIFARWNFLPGQVNEARRHSCAP